MVYIPFKKQIYDLYTRRYLHAVLADKTKVPHHVGIILDGNRRYARRMKLTNVVEGHFKGSEKLEDVIDWVLELGIKVVTIWVFSTENIDRSVDEVNGLMNLFQHKFREMANHKKIHKNHIRIKALGKLEMLTPEVRAAIREAEEKTKDYKDMYLNVAIGYGGKQEIVDAFRSWTAKAVAAGQDLKSAIANLKPQDLDPFCYDNGLGGPPDLIIRTSGRIRLSGFMLWHSPYSELYFTDVLWPAFRKLDFLRAIRAYQLRQRTFGK